MTHSDKAPKPWVDRLMPILVLLTFLVAGTFLTGFALVDEKLRGTLRAIMTTPTRMVDVLAAKSLFGCGVAMFAAVLALVMNDALKTVTPELAVVMRVAAVMTIELGIVLGLLSKDINGLYGAIKAMGPLFALSAFPYIGEGFPLWLA